MNNLLETLIQKKDQKDFREFAVRLTRQERVFHLRNDILLAFRAFCDERKKSPAFREKSSVSQFVQKIQELFIRDAGVIIMHRHAIARYRFYRLSADGEHMDEITTAEYLSLKDSRALGTSADERSLDVDFMPFYDYYPAMRDTKSLGNGIRFLNRYMSSNIFQKPAEWNNHLFEFIKLHKYQGQQLLVNGSLVTDFGMFLSKLENTVDLVRSYDPSTPCSSLEARLKAVGFEPGWGSTAGRIAETMQLLLDLINEPDDILLEKFISSVPMPLVSRVAVISPHGWFGQENVLGRPDTGGQVIYILDQVRALERHLTREIAEAGLSIVPKILVVTRLIPDAGETSCDRRLEKIHHTVNGWILRVPFRDAEQNVVRPWISRFHIWPYLERFADDACREIQSEFQGRPDLIIGNYSDGNLVATLLSDRMDVIQCNIAHALEKTKYLFSDLYWKDNEERYGFSLQFTADLIAMNKADFIITSTHQEIFGTEQTMGQYESYQNFSLPGLYRVINGINLYAPRFNVIPPGVDEDQYFPFGEKERRISGSTEYWESRIFHEEMPDVFGRLKDPGKRPLFTMARFDRIKNITGLIEAFGMSKKLRERCNLIFAAGTTRLEESHDAEERDEIQRAYHLIGRYGLEGSVCWLPSIAKADTGEVYRIMADRGGVFVQPALFEAFGLTILEAMSSGLPTFGPRFGGPLEIIEEGISGFLLNTSMPKLIARDLEAFWVRCDEDPGLWGRISENGMRRVAERFTWRNYSERLINLTKLYGFWRYAVSGRGKVKMSRYCDLLYHFLFRQRAGA